MIEITPTTDTALLAGMIFGAALLYSSVGHAGASGYIAAMALMGVSPATMRPTALVLNILVATLGTTLWHRMGMVNWRVLGPLLAASIPCAFIGGSIVLPIVWYRWLIGVLLLVAAVKLLGRPAPADEEIVESGSVPLSGGLVSGGAVGLLSGLTGTGGGIFLSPILLFAGWTTPRQASGITAPFILFNSTAALAGNLLTLKSLPPELPVYAVAAFAGALVGTKAGQRRASPQLLQRLLGVVLVVAALKFILA